MKYILIFFVFSYKFSFTQDTSLYQKIHSKPAFKKTILEIEGGGQLILPQKNSEIFLVTKEQSPSYFYDWKYEYYQTTGYLFKIGVPIKINKWIDLIPKLNFDNITLKASYEGSTNCASCLIPYQVSVKYTKVITTLNLFGFSPVVRLKFYKKFYLESSIGLSFIINQKTIFNFYDASSGKLVSTTSQIKAFSKNQTFTMSHLIGTELIKNSLCLGLGFTFFKNGYSNLGANPGRFYNSILKNNLYPLLILKLKINQYEKIKNSSNSNNLSL